jgi:ATP-binding cassette subfamily B protein
MGEEPRRRRPEIHRHQRQVLERLSASSFFPVVRQHRGNDCGPAALATVAAYHGCAVDWNELCAEAALDRHGTNLLELSQIAQRLGLRTHGIKASYDAIELCTLPAIAHFRRRLGGGHFVVVHCWTSEYLVIADPAAGLRKLSRRAFCRRSTGYFLIFENGWDRQLPG